MEEDDFAFQLQQEALEAALKKKAEEQKKIDDATSGAASTTDNPHIYRDPSDGTEFEWDHVKKAWFPKISDDFIAKYQASYGTFETEEKNEESEEKATEDDDGSKEGENVTESSATSDDPKSDQNGSSSTEPQSKPFGRKRPPPEDPKWFEVDDEHNTNVYVSNLPLDITDEEFTELMKKCGLIMKDDRNQKLKVKLYRDESGMPKGDGRCCYIKVESVELALNILDGYFFKDHEIKVERAKFALKGQYDPSLKPKKKKRRDKEKQKKRVEALFDWRPDKLPGERPKNEKCVIIKNMFDPKMFESDPKLILEYRSDVREECEEKCGPVRKVEIYDLHPDGVAAVTFHEFEDAEKCIQLMNGRFFAGRKLDAHVWDGKIKYKIQETEEEIEKRMKKWDEYLEKGEEKEEEKVEEKVEEEDDEEDEEKDEQMEEQKEEEMGEETL